MTKLNKYFVKQKLPGNDITMALLLVPLGLYMIFTKRRLLVDDYEEDESEEL